MADSPYIVDVSRENFQQVMEASFRVPVLIDFWAPWCQPCQTLMPILAKLADEYGGKFMLAKLNTEELQDIAGQFGIRSIPAVKLFHNGQPVDEFTGALPENEIRNFLNKHLPRESDQAVEQAQQSLLAGDGDKAIAILQQAAQQDPENHRITTTLAQAQAAMGELQAAEATLDSLPPDEQSKPEITSLRGHLHFESMIADAPPSAELQARLAADENDLDARYHLALHSIIDQDYDSALESLLELMRKDRTYGDDAARKTLLKLFDLLNDDPRVTKYRNLMARMLY